MHKLINRTAVVAALFALLLASSPLSLAQQPATAVGAETVGFQVMNQTQPVAGRFIARQSGDVAARIEAPVADILVDVGDQVSEGQVMVRLVNDRLTFQKDLREAELESAKAALATSKAELDLTTQELRRLEKLRKSAAFNQARLDDKRLERISGQSAVLEAEADVRRATAELRLAELDLAYSEIKAPFRGTVTLRQIDRGDYISEGQTVMTLINADNLEIEAEVPTNRISGLKPGAPVMVRMGEGDPMPTTVRAVVPEENLRTRTRTVRFSPAFDKSDLNLASNQSVIVMVPLGLNRKVLAVHKDAVLTKSGTQSVFIISDGKAAVRTVRLGEATGSYFEVLSGLNEGDVVITRGNERVRPNQAVMAKDLAQ